MLAEKWDFEEITLHFTLYIVKQKGIRKFFSDWFIFLIFCNKISLRVLKPAWLSHSSMLQKCRNDVTWSAAKYH